MPEILEVEAARQVLDAHALHRKIARVHTPDGWYLKRGLSKPVLRDALVGRELTAARRRGKQLLLDTSDRGPTLGLHLGMSGRILVDDHEAGDPLVYASNARNAKWHRFGVHFDDGGSMFLRDPRRLGGVELEPNEARLGVDAFDITKADVDRAVRDRSLPLKAALMHQGRIAGLGNLLVDEALFRAGLDPLRPAASLDAHERAALWRAIRATLRVLGRRGGSHTGDLPRHPGGRCPKDGEWLVRRTIGGRTTWSCPEHQT